MVLGGCFTARWKLIRQKRNGAIGAYKKFNRTRLQHVIFTTENCDVDCRVKLSTSKPSCMIGRFWSEIDQPIRNVKTLLYLRYKRTRML